ncbi:MAG TPA: 16S rRNA (cytosine(1402)-N(4))-methyltransferase RsmH [Candidatus Paceibacterota bacterium]|nr:16S rRNA (cytosine(1402)-N(4))-methyltransferase RsmH [Candidatus Paceibacterota bacterium]
MSATGEENVSGSVHKPVLLNEVITFLDPRLGDFIIDGTVDGGGHAAAIVDVIGPQGTLLGLDWDERLLQKCKARFSDRKNVILVHGNYAELPEILEKISATKNNVGRADGLLIDLGFSSEQLEASGRGFSFGEASKDEPLLMTYDDAQTPVWQILREESEESLANIIFEFGGERMSRRIAKAIKDRGRKKPIMTSGELAEVVRGALPGMQKYEHGRIDPATRTFQAFRIYANGELENLKKLLSGLGQIVKPGGRVAIITFHSVEDGIVKRAFQSLAKESKIEIITKKPVEASREEVRENPRSRSAKIRAARMI